MITRKAEEIAPFMVMEVLERAQVMESQGIDIIHLEVGEPDFDIPAAVNAAICTVLDKSRTGGRYLCTSPAMMLVFARCWSSEMR